MARLWQQTEREKRGHVAGLGLFFGALLGANLGTLAELALGDYVFLVVLLVGAVTTIQVAAASERRLYSVGLILAYVLLLGAVYLFPDIRPEIRREDLEKMFVTLAIWLGAVVMVEAAPTVPSAESRNEGGESEDATGTADARG
jgi:hypothetical protein